MTEELKTLLAEAAERWRAMTKGEKQAMILAQRLSFARGEAAFGSDADEAEYRMALESGNSHDIIDCKLREQQRIADAIRFFRESF